ncbi:MAG: hypothetical protein KGI58_02600 [Patescibacteria group bacterium]|nr:hypothetical protein [Patescibacteria group bacterium]
MNYLYNKIIIAFAIIMLLGGVYTYFSNGLNAQAANSTPDSSLSSSAQSDPLNAGVSNNSSNKITQDTSFLYALASLNSIKIDTSIFGNPLFNTLNDNTVTLDPVVPGRSNPFAPIDKNAPLTTAQISPVTTNIPTQVTNNSAIFNGRTSSMNGVSNVFFEYGTTQSLGKTTQDIKQSLVGTFSTSISGLTSSTMYFYRAVAKINGNVEYGDIVSFSTN